MSIARLRPVTCAKGHNDWIVTDPIKGWRRCKTCRRINSGRGAGVSSASAFGVDTNGKKQNSRGAGEDDTWGRTELPRYRGYDV